MFQFKRGLRTKYKTEKGFLSAVYRMNKDVINEVGYTESQFINRVIAGKEYNPSYKTRQHVTVIQALKDLAATKAFTPYSTRANENVIQGLKTFDKWTSFRNLTKDIHGRYTKVDSSKFVYLGDDVYLYDGLVMISFNHSPEDVTLSLVK